MARRLVPAVALLLALSALLGCDGGPDRREAACRNLQDLPERARSERVDAFAVEGCGQGAAAMCTALGTYLAQVVAPDMDPVEALTAADEDRAVAVLARAFRRAERRVGDERAAALNGDVVEAAAAMGGVQGGALVEVMHLMPGGPDLLSEATPPSDLIAIRVILERAVDICTARP